MRPPVGASAAENQRLRTGVQGWRRAGLTTRAMTAARGTAQSQASARSQGSNPHPQNRTQAKRVRGFVRQRSFQCRIISRTTGRSKTWLKGATTVGTIVTVRVSAKPKATTKAQEFAGWRRARQPNEAAMNSADRLTSQFKAEGEERRAEMWRWCNPRRRGVRRDSAAASRVEDIPTRE